MGNFGRAYQLQFRFILTPQNLFFTSLLTLTMMTLFSCSSEKKKQRQTYLLKMQKIKKQDKTEFELKKQRNNILYSVELFLSPLILVGVFVL